MTTDAQKANRVDIKTPSRASRLTSGFQALHIRNYRLFWSGQVVSLIGSWMQTTAQDWLVLKLTESPLALGTVTALQFLPITLLALFGGVLADRLPKRQTLIVTQSILMIQAFIFGLLVATGVIQLWHIYVLATLQGIVTAIDNPMRQAFIAEVVGREHLVNAVALNSMSFNAARVVGPGLAGLVIAKIGIAPTLFVNAVSFIAVLWAYFMMDVTSLHAAPPSTKVPARQQLVEGLSYTWHTRPILLIMLIVGIIGTFGFNFSVILPLLANFVLHTDAAGYGALSSFLGIGALIAAVSSAYVHHVTMRRLLIGSAAFSVVLALVAISATFTVSAMLLVALGFSGIIFSTTSNTLLQLLVPNELRGRVMSLYVLLFMGSTPIGGFLIGFLANTIGVSAGLVFCAALCLVGVIAVLIYRRATPNETIAA